MRRDDGQALIAALLALVVTGALTSTLTDGARWVASDRIDRRAAAGALQAAEGGIAFARAALRRDPEFAGTQLTIGAARVTVDVQASGIDRWQVRARAECQPRGERGLPYRLDVDVILERRAGTPAVVSWSATDAPRR